MHDVALDDPRLADYRNVKDRQLAEVFSEHAPGVRCSGDPDAPYGRFMAEGEVVYRVLAGSGLRVLSVLCTPTRLETMRETLATLDERTPIYVLPPESVNRLVGFPLHRGLMAIGARAAPRSVASVVDRAVDPRRHGVLLVLDALTNHDNVGGCFRSAAAFGAAGVLLTGGTVDPLYRKSLRVSVGHALRVPFARHDGPTIDLVRTLRSRGVLVAALTPACDAVELRSLGSWEGRKGCGGDVDRTLTASTPVALVLGAEGAGLDPAVQAACDVRVRIGISPEIDSLNVVVAGSIALHELQRGR